jgi:AcrR family transcriptional regulator
VEGRRERKKRELRERIYETARQLFLENGFAATTVEQIAEGADVSQTTFFNHFQSKDALLREMTSEVSERLETMLDEQLARQGTAAERISRFADGVVVGIGQADGLARDVLLELMRTSSHSGGAFPYLARVYDPFTAILAEGQQAGNVREDVDARLLAEMVIGTLHMALVGWLNDPDYRFKERLAQFTELLAETLEPRAARSRRC